jgi:hypothetical protein
MARRDLLYNVAVHCGAGASWTSRCSTPTTLRFVASTVTRVVTYPLLRRVVATTRRVRGRREGYNGPCATTGRRRDDPESPSTHTSSNGGEGFKALTLRTGTIDYKSLRSGSFSQPMRGAPATCAFSKRFARNLTCLIAHGGASSRYDDVTRAVLGRGDSARVSATSKISDRLSASRLEGAVTVLLPLVYSNSENNRPSLSSQQKLVAIGSPGDTVHELRSCTPISI